MGFLTGKTAIITGAGYATLSDGRCGSIGYGMAALKRATERAAGTDILFDETEKTQ